MRRVRSKRWIERNPVLGGWLFLAFATLGKVTPVPGGVPVMLAAGTTIAGMSPLLRDAFFREMAVCIMGGLAFATLLTLVAVPVFYRIAMGRKLREGSGASAQDTTPDQ